MASHARVARAATPTAAEATGEVTPAPGRRRRLLHEAECSAKVFHARNDDGGTVGFNFFCFLSISTSPSLPPSRSIFLSVWTNECVSRVRERGVSIMNELCYRAFTAHQQVVRRILI